MWLFRHLKNPNMSIGDDFMHSSEMIFLVPFFAFKEALALLVNDSIIWG